jgi:ABC-2 type transport system permease protein
VTVPPAAAPAWRSTLALTAFELRLSARRGENLLVTLVIPSVVLVFFSSVGVLAVPGRPVDFLLPGALALGVIATSFVNLGIATAYDRHYGVLKRLGGAPVPRASVVVAKILAVLAIEIVQVALLVVIATLALGWRPGDGGIAPLPFLAALALGTAAFAGLGLAMAGALRAEATLALANGLFLAFLLLGGIVLPLDHLPGPLGALGAVLPAAPLAELFRVGLGGAGDALAAAARLGGWAIVVVALAVRAFRWE